MSDKALIDPTGRVVQIVPAGEDFPVHASLSWVDVTGAANVGDTYDAAAKTFAAPVQTQADINAQAQAAISGLHRQAVPLLLQFITAKFATDPLFPAALGTINGHLAAQKAKIK